MEQEKNQEKQTENNDTNLRKENVCIKISSENMKWKRLKERRK